MTTQDLGGDQDGQTPVDADDAQYLTPEYSTLRTRGELNDAEASNITDALLWLDDQELTTADLLNQSFLRDLHRRMFADVWTWAGQLRQRDTTIGIAPIQIQEQLQALRPAAEARQRYLAALRAADKGDYRLLLENAVS